MAKANACCSIELEPKTLNQGQLHQAREVAADVAHKVEPGASGASFSLFTDHVNPTMEERRGELPPLQPERAPERAQDYSERMCQCSCLPTESPNQLQLLKEPLSAPF